MDRSGQRLLEQAAGKDSLQKTTPRAVHEHLALRRMDYYWCITVHAQANGCGAPGISLPKYPELTSHPSFVMGD